MHRPRHHSSSTRTKGLRLVAVAAALTFGIALTVRAGEPPAAVDPVFEVLQVDGRTSSGRITAIAPDRVAVTSADGQAHEIPLTALVKLSRENTRGRAAEGADVALPDGDRLMNVIVGPATDAAVEVHSYALGKMSVPLDSVLGLILTPPMDAEALDRLWERVRTQPRTSEVVWLGNGDRIAGTLLGVDDRLVKLQVQGKPMEIDRAGITAVGFDPALVSYPRPTTSYFEATLVDGTRLGLVDVKLDKGNVSAVTRFGRALRFPLADVVRLVPRTSAVDYLSERPVNGHSYVPYLGPVRPFRIDATVEGRPFQLGGRTYDRGLGAQSRTLIAYKLKPGDRRFQALVGVDDRAGPLGSVAFRVMVDGQSRFTTPPMTARDAPRPIDVDVTGAKLLILITEFGDRGDVRDFADWVEARVVR
ncbi:MAG: NPCBM/NEW2 domain-containing protein [Paludisphaera borealis]|uniref:NPCBM/NEW2 domain-containing protein n=1 Tax=Paludisphaera borealis TaxID=1387353 RepID=UPI002845AB16|nr:NPCBM/NEW2 domain-containing protein [Paludisphaera borealis]MDR3617826.1 NPCBM/NEW2 domain-containing protein [Paludisphaera borealis]